MVSSLLEAAVLQAAVLEAAVLETTVLETTVLEAADLEATVLEATILEAAVRCSNGFLMAAPTRAQKRSIIFAYPPFSPAHPQPSPVAQ